VPAVNLELVRAFQEQLRAASFAREKSEAPPTNLLRAQIADEYIAGQVCLNERANPETYPLIWKHLTEIGTGHHVPMTGRIPFWDLPHRESGAHIIGADSEVFHPSPGIDRIFVHYGDTKRQARLGEPTDSLDARMTTSPRTLLVELKDGRLVELKVPGDFISGFEHKGLTEQDAERALTISQMHPEAEELVPEMSAIAREDVVNICRPFLVDDGDLHPGDHLSLLHSILSPDFPGTDFGKTIFPTTEARERWFAEEHAPRVAKFIAESLLTLCSHYELHTQNQGLLVAESGHLRRLRIKDQQDAQEDPLMRLALHQENRNSALLQDPRFASVGQLGAGTEDRRIGGYIENIYNRWMGQAGYPKSFYLALWDALTKELRQRLGGMGLRRLVERVPTDPTPDIFAVGEKIAQTRDAVLMDAVVSRFDASSSAESRFEDPNAPVFYRVTADTPQVARLNTSIDWEFGYFQGRPAALSRRNGQLQGYRVQMPELTPVNPA
jgi:hypothetical protein